LGHPTREKLRRKKKEKQAWLARKNNLDVLDLTPFNAVRLICNANSSIVYR